MTTEYLSKFDNAFIHSAMLMEAGEFDGAIEHITTAFDKLRNPDVDLVISKKRWIGLILRNKVDLDQALLAYLEVEIPVEHSEYGINQLDIAGIFLDSNQPSQAQEIFNHLVVNKQPDRIVYGMYLLKLFAEKIDQLELTDRILQFANEMVEIMDFANFDFVSSDSIHFKKSIERFWEINLEKGLQFSELNQNISNQTENSTKLAFIEKFQNEIGSGYYQSQAEIVKLNLEV